MEILSIIVLIGVIYWVGKRLDERAAIRFVERMRKKHIAL